MILLTYKRSYVLPLVGIILLIIGSVVPALAGDLPYTQVAVSDCSMVAGSSATATISVSIENPVENPVELRGIEVHLTFDPAFLEVIDADPYTAGVQIAPADFFDGEVTIPLNLADNTAGTIDFAITHLDGTPVYNTDGLKPVATITFKGKAAGETTVVVETTTKLSDAQGYPIEIDELINGQVTITDYGRIRGSVHMQGRYDHSGVRVTAVLVDPNCCDTLTDVAGDFEIVITGEDGYYEVRAVQHGYLTARLTSPVWVEAGTVVDVGPTRLWAGDVTDDEMIDICDIAYIAGRFLTTDTTADINGDGLVDILDLAVTAANFGKVGPTPWEP